MARKKRCKVFVSYSRHDEAFVKPLAGLLGAAADDAIFLDIESIKPGNLWKAEIENAVRTSSVFILCWCCQSESSEFVQYEIELALEGKEKRLVPVLLCSTPLPGSLTDRQWVDLRGRIIHSCSRHDLTKEHEIQLQLPKGRTEGIQNPPAAALEFPGMPRTLSRRWPILAALSALLVFGLALSYLYVSAPKPLPKEEAVQRSTVCMFLDGPRVGQTQDFAQIWPSPLSVGSPCQDGAGSQGRVIPLPAGPVPGPTASPAPQSGVVYVGVALVAVLLLWWLYKTVRRRKRRREADKFAALATSYFEELDEA